MGFKTARHKLCEGLDISVKKMNSTVLEQKRCITVTGTYIIKKLSVSGEYKPFMSQEEFSECSLK